MLKQQEHWFESLRHARLTAIKSEVLHELVANLFIVMLPEVPGAMLLMATNATIQVNFYWFHEKNRQSFYYFKDILMMIHLIAVSFACPKDPHKLLLKVVSEIS